MNRTFWFALAILNIICLFSLEFQQPFDGTKKSFDIDTIETGYICYAKELKARYGIGASHE